MQWRAAADRQRWDIHPSVSRGRGKQKSRVHGTDASNLGRTGRSVIRLCIKKELCISCFGILGPLRRPASRDRGAIRTGNASSLKVFGIKMFFSNGKTDLGCLDFVFYLSAETA